MFKSASRILYLAPAITFGMGATYILTSFALGVSPQSPAVWHAFLTLAPLTRDPVNLIDSIPGVDYGTAFTVFALLTMASLLMAFTSWGSNRLRFVTSHLALFPLIYSMGSISLAYSSVGGAAPLSLGERFSQFLDFSSPSMPLVALFACALAAALHSHTEFLDKIITAEKARKSVREEYRKIASNF